MATGATVDPRERHAGWVAPLCWMAVALEGFDLVVLGVVLPALLDPVVAVVGSAIRTPIAAGRPKPSPPIAALDRLAEQHGAGKAPWPAFEEVSISRLAEGLGCPATRVATHDELLKVLDDVVPTLGERTEPLVLEVPVVPDTTFAP